MDESQTFGQVHQELCGLLTHLYDPDYETSSLMRRLTGSVPQGGVGSVQSSVVQLVRSLEPDAGVPAEAHTRRIFDILNLRYVLKLTQEETAERLAMSPRHVRRLQREATHHLARLLWERAAASSSWDLPNDESANSAAGVATTSGRAWRQQIKEDLASLRSGRPAAFASVEDAIRNAVELERPLSAQHETTLALGPIPSDGVVAMHPSALRQVLLAAIGLLLRDAPAGRITIGAEQAGSHTEVILTGPWGPPKSPPDCEFIEEVLTAQGGSFDATVDADHVTMRLHLPAAGPVPVLVVDDNPGMVHFYGRCTRGTKYAVYSAEGARLFDVVDEAAPAIIVLDMMLPDVDGWELLADLHAHPATRSVPVIVCSVVREEELALALGATIYLRKPVLPRRFIEALDHVFDRSPSEGRRPQGRREADR